MALGELWVNLRKNVIEMMKSDFYITNHSRQRDIYVMNVTRGFLDGLILAISGVDLVYIGLMT